MGFVNLHGHILGLSPHSTPLVPAFSFGENDLFDQVSNPKGSWLRRIQHRLQQVMGISLPLFHARGIFQYSFGLVPYRRPICTVGKSLPSTRLAKVGDQGSINTLLNWGTIPESTRCRGLAICWQWSISNCSPILAFHPRHSFL